MTDNIKQLIAKRHRHGDFTEEEVLIIAEHSDFRVHKYRWSHTALRKLTRRMCRDGKLRLAGFDGTNFIYRKADMIPRQSVFPPLTSPLAVSRVKDPLPKPETCPCCGGQVELVPNEQIYGRPYGDWPYAYACVDCDAYVGVHPETLIPLGTLADSTLRNQRRLAKAAFEPIWRQKGSHRMPRSQAYIWLALRMGIPTSECHFAWFDAERCMIAQHICEDYMKEQQHAQNSNAA